MKKLLRWFRTLVIGLALLVLLGCAVGYGLWRYQLPGYLHQQLAAALAEAGFANARFQIESISPDRVEVIDLALDDAGRLSAERVTVRFKLLKLLGPGADELIVQGARWRIVIDDGELDLGLPKNLLRASGDGELPFGRLELRDCAIELVHGDTSWEIPILGQFPDQPTLPLTICFDAGKQLFRFDRPTKQSLPNDPLLAVVRRLVPQVELAGSLGASGTLDLAGQVHATLALSDGTVSLSTPASQFKDVSGQVRLVGPAWRTVARPSLRWQSARVGELDLGPGTVQFQYARGEPIFIERLFARLGPSGRLWAHAFEIDPQAVDLKINLFWEAIDLDDFLDIVTAGHASGSGKLYGRLPVRIRTQPRLRLAFGAGYLMADEGGRVRIEDQKLIRQVMAGHMPALAGDADTRAAVEDRFVQALQDFQYSKLRFVLYEEDQQSVLRLELAGAGRVVDQELNLTVNFRGISGLIDLMLRAKLAMAAAEEKLKAGLRSK